VNLSADGVLDSIKHILVMGKQQKLPLSFQLIQDISTATIVKHNNNQHNASRAQCQLVAVLKKKIHNIKYAIMDKIQSTTAASKSNYCSVLLSMSDAVHSVCTTCCVLSI